MTDVNGKGFDLERAKALTTDQKLDIILAFIHQCQQVAEKMGQHPMLAAMFPPQPVGKGRK